MKKFIAIIVTLIIVCTMCAGFAYAANSEKVANVAVYGLNQLATKNIKAVTKAGQIKVVQIWDGGECIWNTGREHSANITLEPNHKYMLLVRVQGIFDDISINGTRCWNAKSTPTSETYDPYSEEYYVNGRFYFTTPNFVRCPFCGEENVFLWENDDYGHCVKCGEDTLRYNITIKAKSGGNEDGLMEAKLYQHGKLVKLYQMHGNDDVTTMHSVQHGVYTLVVTKAGHASYARLICLNKDMTVYVRLYPFTAELRKL